ncbi:MAG: hypothetical protein M1826_005888 [Phylliscum demangeonii]|nr:MAG: hypothetical protein M1826_005888 [Phylliscum demangeonii]
MSKQLKEDVIEFVKGIPDDRIDHLYTPGITPGLLFESKLLRFDWQNKIIEFLEGIADDKIHHLYTPGITPGTLFKDTLLRLDWQKTNVRRTKKKQEWLCAKGISSAGPCAVDGDEGGGWLRRRSAPCPRPNRPRRSEPAKKRGGMGRHEGGMAVRETEG